MSDFPISSLIDGSDEDLILTLSIHSLSLLSIKDKSGNTILHMSLHNEKPTFIHHLISNEKNFSTPFEISDWINQINHDGYTILHLIVSKGLLPLVKLLIQNGANLDIKTPMGLDVVHLAAQGDFPQLIAYFAEIGVGLESIDTKGLTPLHWSSYMGNYYSSLILCSLRVSRNAIDLEGHTPLHLAVIGNNLRVVKLLVIKGAIKNIKDSQGKTSIDHANVNGYKNLIESLTSNTFLEIMGFRPNITPFATSLWPFILLMGIVISTFVVVGIFCATCKNNRQGSYAFAASSILVICLMVYIVNSDPGFVPKSPNTKLTELYNNYKSGEICPDCGIVKVSRSRHCHQCHRCVKKFDHHCQWMNNCIGAKNLGVFYGFILILWVNIIVAIWLCCWVFISEKNDNDGDDIPLLASWIVGGLFVVIEFFMFVPVSFLLWTHTKNFATGLTTNERVSAGNTTKKSSKNCCANWKDMCCNSNQQEDGTLRSNYESIFSENLEESLHQIK